MSSAISFKILATRNFLYFLIGLIILIFLFFKMSSPDVKAGTIFSNVDELEDVPQHILNKMETIIVIDRQISVPMGGEDLIIHIKEANPSAPKKLTVVFLHGSAFSSETWNKLSTLKLVAAMGHAAVALDLPGWGSSVASRLSQLEDQKSFLGLFLQQMNITKPVLITPSMSGIYAISYMMEPYPETCDERLTGLVALAPVYTESFTHSQYHKCKIPVLIAYGSKDVHLGLLSLNNLRNMPHHEIFEIKDSGHAFYYNKPLEWHKLLYHFINH